MRVRIKAYASLRRFVPGVLLGRPSVLELVDGTTIGEALDQIGLPRREARICFVNGRCQDIDHPLCDDDELAVFPPIGGGTQ